MCARDPSYARRPVSCALISVPLTTIVVTWSSFAVVAVTTFARALANDGSGADGVVVAAWCESLPQPARIGARTAARAARRTRGNLHIDRADAFRARLSCGADDVDERRRGGRKRNARVHSDVAYYARLDLEDGTVDAADDDIVGNEGDAQPGRSQADGALRLGGADGAARREPCSAAERLDDAGEAVVGG